MGDLIMHAKWIEADGRFAFGIRSSGGIEITAEEHAALMSGQAAGKRIVPDKNGRPVLVDPPAPSADQLAASARARRDALIAASDWVVLRAQETGESVPDAWLKYRRALRDVPSQKGFPAKIKWPATPDAV